MKDEPKPNEHAEEIAKLLREIIDLLKSQPVEDNLYYDNSDMKKNFNLSDSTLYRLRKAKIIPYQKLRGKIFYPKSFFKKAFI